MTRSARTLFALALGSSLALTAGSAMAEPGRGWHGGGDHGRAVEPERAPQGYQRVERPSGAEVRPQQFDRQVYNHNFTAERGYHIGPYHAPRGFAYRRWGYGEFLPRIYWAQRYWLSDYWLFGLDVPPVGCEWVRYGPDALLINISTGEVIQVLYGRFL
jgi:Ni/Co efflux regulator RcnB